jgi:ribonuclease HII
LCTQNGVGSSLARSISRAKDPKGGHLTENLVCGIDEAGRGPLAGPVTAAAVILPKGFPCELLADSKALTPEKRKRTAAVIRAKAVSWAVGWAWPEEIDRINIHRATLLAMARAVNGLSLRPGLLLVDGLFTPRVDLPCRAVVKGDATVPQIMAASILAKTARDSWMERYSRIEPDYGFERHKGYPTAEHRRIIRRLGLSVIHRRSFRVTFCE